MASEAEVDLVISTAGALPQLERDLGAIIQTAEADADALNLQALLDTEASLEDVLADVNRLVAEASAAGEDIVLQARLDQQEALSDVLGDVQTLVSEVELAAQEIQLQAELDQETAALDAELAALVAELEASAPEIDIEVNIDRDGSGNRATSALTKGLKGAVGPLLKVAGGIGAAAVAASSAAPLLAGIAGAVQQIAPAAAVAVPSLIAVQLATNTVKIAMIGVGEAVSTAFDPEAKPEDLAKAMEKLAPNAKAFVTELASMRKGFQEIQQDVQDDFFMGFDSALRDLSANVLPSVATAVRSTAVVLNEMALGAAAAAAKLGEDGTLGRALDGATKGLGNLTKIPGQVVTALGQIGAAAAPAFDRITQGAANAATGIADKLSKAFESNALEDAINTAIDSIVQLGRVFGNVFEGLGNIMGTLSESGGSLFGTLEKITQAFADVTATEGFQDALKALSSVLSTVVATVLPLLSQALQALGPVFEALGPPIELLVKALGGALGPIIEALGPVLVSLAGAFGQLVQFVTPFIALAGQLIAAILPVLSPLLDAVGQAINAMIPFAQQISDLLAATLVPLFGRLATEVLPQLLPPLVELSSALLPVLMEVLAELSPSLIQLSAAFGDLLVALVPVILQFIELTAKMFDEFMPVIQPILDLIVKLIEIGLKVLVFEIQAIVIPAIGVLVDLLNGDFSAAWEGVKDIIRNVASKVGELITAMKDKAVEQLRILADQAVAKVRELRDRAVEGFADMVNRAVAEISKLPGRARDSLGDLGSVLFSAGADLVRGFINGIQSRLGALREAASSIAGSISGSVKDFLGISSPSKVMMGIGNDTMDGLMIGIADKVPDLRRELRGVAALAPSFGLPGGGSISLPQSGRAVPTVQVYLGNELIDRHVDTRIAYSNQARDRLVVRGVRR